MEMEEGRGGEETAEEVLYEICRHARRALTPDSPQEAAQSSGSKGGLLLYLSLRGAQQLKKKWGEYRRPKMVKKRMSLFVSPLGEHVAVAAGNQIVILQKDDDYMEPCGIFVGNDRLSVFTNGAWLEPQGILGVIDDMSTLFFIKSNGEEITRRTRSQLKLSAPIVDLIVQDDINQKKSVWCGFCILTADCMFHHIEITRESNAFIYSLPSSSSTLTENGQFPHNVFCLDIHPDQSLVVLLGVSSVSANSSNDTEAYSLYLLRITTGAELELLFCSPQFEGLFSSPKEHIDHVTPPKVAISPHAKFVASLDSTGCVDIFNLGTENFTLSRISSGERKYPQISNSLVHGSNRYLNHVIDISWWTDHILILAKSGNIIMYNILSGKNVLENDPLFCMPVIERVKHRQECAFILEVVPFEGKLSMSAQIEDTDVRHMESSTSLKHCQLDSDKLSWTLTSLSGKSVSEMYTILISSRQFQAALDFAIHHGLDKDEVFKAQWLCSEQGAPEIDMFLSKIKDKAYVLSECINKVGPTEDAVKILLSYGLLITDEFKFPEADCTESSLIWDFRIARLQLLQYRDMLETFIGINMGRFSGQEYSKFRSLSFTEAAVSLAECGKIGALNLLFKRHPYSLSPRVLDILSAVPETIPVQSYGQLLPGRSPPSTIFLRDEDWVECEKMVSFINNCSSRSDTHIMRTENILKHSLGLVWPSVAKLSEWYKNRAREIDNLSGQLDNCLSLLEFACHKGIAELQHFHEDISYLHQLIYSDGCDDFALCLGAWEQLPDYEKFRMMLKGVTEETVVERLQSIAIPFMQKRCCVKSVDSENQMKVDQSLIHHEERDSFSVRWLKENAANNRLDICLAVIENRCGDSPIDGLFKDEAEIIKTSLHCIYLCTLTDQWNTMASILSKLPRKTIRDKGNKDLNPSNGKQGSGTPRFSYMRSQFSKSEMQSSSSSLHEGDSSGIMDQLGNDVTDDELEKRIKVAEGHVEVGRLLAYYQVPKPISFFVGGQADEKNVKQLLRLILSKFGRRQPGRSDNDWASMWHDMQRFQDKAFPFLDTEYMLIEFCRGLLKAGKFPLARNYLRGTGTVSLATEKAENLVILAAREYFFSASSLACTEIWKAKECLSLFPNSRIVQAEADVIDAITIRLPNLGVTLLPMQFKQIRNPMEIINMVMTSQTGAYLNVEEIIEIARILGLSSSDDIAVVEEAIAREAAVAGDLQLAFDLCLVLSKKGHGQIWDLCAAIARGPNLDNMDTASRKQLLGFALSHCDEESIGELLHAWKDVDIHLQCEKLMISTRTSPPNFSLQGSSVTPLPVHSIQDIFDLRGSSDPLHHEACLAIHDDHVHIKNIKDILSKVSKDLSSTGDGSSLDSLLRENRKVLSFAALELPWLLELIGKEEYGKKGTLNAKAPSRKHCISIRLQAVVSILSWLAGNDIAPSDDLIATLAKSIMETPFTEEDDALGCSFLLNLMDAFQGVEIIEEQLKQREGYQEIHSIMNIGMTYSSLHSSHKECFSPDERRKLLLYKFQEKHASFTSDKLEQIDKAQTTFWKKWKTKLEEQKRLTDEARALEQIIPGIETARFLSGDAEYIKSVIFSYIDSAKTEKKHILKEAVKLADTYGLERSEVLLRFFGCALVSKHWGNDDILNEISEYRDDIVRCAKGVIKMISLVVYPEIDGRNKERLSYIYSILSACYLRLKKSEESAALVTQHKHKFEPFQFYKVIEQECQRVSFISDLDFKNISGLDDLNFVCFNDEISCHINESTVEALADMVRTFGSMYSGSSEATSLMPRKEVYKHHVLDRLAILKSKIEAKSDSLNPNELQGLIIGEIEQDYDCCRKYVCALSEPDKSLIIWRYCTLCIPCSSPSWKLSDKSTAWKDCLLGLLKFWIKLFDEQTTALENSTRLSGCLKGFKRLVMEDEIPASNGWVITTDFIKVGPSGDGLMENLSCFFRAMIFSGCGFKSIAEVYNSEAEEQYSTTFSSDGKLNNLLDLYVNLTDRVLSDLSRGCNKQRDLHLLLSSLSRMEEGSHVEYLKAIRQQVWEKVSAYSDDMQLESHVRVYILELMQTITGQNLTSLPAELVLEVKPWEAWDGKTSMTAEREDVSGSITSTLVALKSTQLATALSPDIKITPEDLMTLDSSVSCYLHLSETATSPTDLDVLQSILEEWEVLFPNGSIDSGKVTAESSVEELNNWSSDEWDNEGWENLPEEEIGKRGEHDGSQASVCAFHTCWMEISRRLIRLSRPRRVLELLDQSLLKPGGVGLLLDEEEAQCLCQLVVGTDCLMALRMVLLLPYEGPRFHCLQVVEAKLKDGCIMAHPSSSVDGYELLTLVLSSGVVRDIITNPSFSKVSSYLCHLLGHLARLCQEDLLKSSSPDRNRSSFFGRVLLPCFISELVKAGQCLLAGFIVSKWMHTPSMLSLIDIAEVCLRKYLEGQLLQAQQPPGGGVEPPLDSCGSLQYTVTSLRCKVGGLLESALSSLPTDTLRKHFP